MVEKSRASLALQVGSPTPPRSQETLLIIREASTRRRVSEHSVRDRAEAIAIYTKLGSGYDARIITPTYVEVILSIRSAR